MRTLRSLMLFLILLTVFVVSLLFSIENSELITVNFIVLEQRLPTSVWTFLCVLFGLIIGVVASMGWLLRAQRLLAQRNKLQRLNTP